MTSCFLYETLFSNDHTFFLLQSATEQSALPVLQSVLTHHLESEKFEGFVVLVSVLHPPYALVADPELCGKRRVKLLDFTHVIPGYTTANQETSLSEMVLKCIADSEFSSQCPSIQDSQTC